MPTEARGLAYFHGLEGDFTGDTRSVAWVPAVLTVPEETPFLIETVSVSGFRRAETASSSGTSSRGNQVDKVTIARHLSAKSSELLRSAAVGQHFKEVLINMGASGDARTVYQYRLEDAVIVDHRVDPIPDAGPNAVTEVLDISFIKLTNTYYQ